MPRTARLLDRIFAALADPTRRAILARLALGEATVNELTAPFSISQPAISRHLKVLEEAGLISRGRDAQRRPCRIEGKPLADVNRWLENYRRFWEARYERLDALLAEMQTPPGKQQRKSRKEPRGRGRSKAMPGKVGTGFPSGIATSKKPKE
jgi:DNA-binding transcriptional ArsR family regulator